MTVGFLLSRVLFYLLRVRFDGGPLEWSWQLLDPVLLRTDLLRSLWYLHSSPPLFNLMVGGALKIFPSAPFAALHAAMIVSGLILATSMFLLLRRLLVSEPVAILVTTLFVASPPAILFENHLSYTWPVAALLCCAGLLLHRFLTSGAVLDGSVFFLAVACATLTVAFFHLVWLLAVVLLVWAGGTIGWRRVLGAALAPVMLVVGWYAKNGVLFGSFSSTSWLGMNLAKVAEFSLSEAEKRQLVSAGVTSPLVFTRPFLPITAYVHPDRLAVPGRHPAVDQPFKSNGQPNLNHRLFGEVADHYRRDVMGIIARHPRAYLKGVALAALVFCRPADTYWLLLGNDEHLGLYARAFDLVVSGAFFAPLLSDRERLGDQWLAGERWFGFLSRAAAKAGVFVAVSVVLSLLGGARLIGTLRRRQPLRAADAATLGFLWLTVAYALVVGNLAELGENFRFRFMVDPLVWILLAAAYGGGLRRVASAAAGDGRQPSPTLPPI